MQSRYSKQISALSSYGSRVARRRSRDPYFDGLCMTYQDVDTQINALVRKSRTHGKAEIEHLEAKRDGLLNTILFMLDDHDALMWHAA